MCITKSGSSVSLPLFFFKKISSLEDMFIDFRERGREGERG